MLSFIAVIIHLGKTQVLDEHGSGRKRQHDLAAGKSSLAHQVLGGWMKKLHAGVVVVADV